MINEGRVTVNVEGGISYITFFHPQSNSLPGKLLRSLADNIAEAGDDPSVRVIVLQSEGDRAFCAGASFDELIAVSSFDEGRNFFSGFAMVINAMRMVPKFVLVRVQGKAVGGGVGLVAGADYALAHTSADIKLSELAIGIGPFVVGPAVERKIGNSAFVTLSVNASEWQKSAWAHEKGLYAEIHESHEALSGAVKNLATRLAAYNPDAMKNLKLVFWKGTEKWDSMLIERAEISGALVMSDFTREAIARFKAGMR